MLNKLFAITALIVFFFAHFGRMINYLYCKGQTYVQTASFVCDCEKQLFAGLLRDNGNHKEQSPQNITTPLQDEICYHLPRQNLLQVKQISISTKWPPADKQSLYKQFSKSIFRPPLQPAA